MLCRPAVPLAPPLPSTASAPGRPALFGRFPGTMGGSDFPGSCISGLRPWPCRCGLAQVRPAIQGPPGFRVDGVPACMGSRTAQGRRAPRHDGARRVAFRFSLQRRRPGHSTFRGSIPSPPFPLSTLRRRPYERRRMNSGPLWAATPSTYDSFIRIHPPASRRAENVRPQFPFLRQPPDTTRSPLVRAAEISRCFRGL